MMKKLIIFVCRGNIVRSPIAESLLKKKLVREKLADQYEVISRGIQGTVVDPKPAKFPNITYYQTIYAESKPTLDKLQIDLSDHRSTVIDQQTVDRASLILAMDDRILNGLRMLFPKNIDKIHLFSSLVKSNKQIIDPETVSGVEAQRRIIMEIANIIEFGFKELIFLAN